MYKNTAKLTKEELEKYKQEAIGYIKESYFMFKVCECCDSIVEYDTAVCFVCKNYRFDESRKRVLEQARIAENDNSVFLF
jgi:hypothetical protein